MIPLCCHHPTCGQMWHGQCAFLLYANKPSRFPISQTPSESDLWVLSEHALDFRCSAQYLATSHTQVCTTNTYFIEETFNGFLLITVVFASSVKVSD